MRELRSIIGFKCASCDSKYKILYTKDVDRDEDYLNLVLSRMCQGCPSCKGNLRVSTNDDLLLAQSYTLENFWNLMSGFKDLRGIQVVEGVLLNGEIKSVDLEELPTGRCALKSILLASGKRIHLAVGHGWPVVHQVSSEEQEQCQEE